MDKYVDDNTPETRLIIKKIFGNYIMPEKMTCWSCGKDIIEYFHKNYENIRGKCPICNVKFPLD